MQGNCHGVLYFAYGEHMNEQELLHDVPAARCVGLTRLPGFSLCFVGKDGVARAALETNPRDSVPGRVWSLSEADVAKLDRIADVPYFSRREIRQIVLDGMKLPVLVYITVPGQQRGRPGFVSFDLMREAYSLAGENVEALKGLTMKCVP